MTDNSGYVALLSLSAFLGLLISIHIAIRMGRFLNFRTLLILSYVVTYPVSGVVHLLNLPGVSRGYYDLLKMPGIGTATVGCILGLVALCTACLTKVPAKVELRPAPRQYAPLGVGEKTFVAMLGAIVIPASLYALIQMQQYAQATEQARIANPSGGLARFSILSNWLTWVITVIAICLLVTKPSRGVLFAFMVGAVSVVLIVLTLEWTGGRSILILMIFPLVLLWLPRIRGLRFASVAVGILAMLLLFFSIGQKRFGNATWSNGGPEIPSILDWQQGRFSILGFASYYVDQHSFLYGRTFVAAIGDLALPVLNLAGAHVVEPNLQNSSQIIGGSILGDPTAVYIVAGQAAELYLNFGVWGILVGFYILGRTGNWVDRRFDACSSLFGSLFFAYLGTLLVLRTISADSGAIFFYLLFSGLPLILLAGFSALYRTALNPTEQIHNSSASGGPRRKLPAVGPAGRDCRTKQRLHIGMTSRQTKDSRGIGA